MDLYESPDLQLEPCSFCGRKFAVENLRRHKSICEKTSRKRPVFDSSKQRKIDNAEKKFASKTKTFKMKKNPSPNPIKSSNWRQKHEEFMRTVKAAREATTAIKEGKKLPPPPPAAINPDYIQCPHCFRRFNETASERHILFCAEQSKRLSNKKPVSISNQAAMRASARQKYRPPLLHTNKKKVSVTPSSRAANARSKPFSERSGITRNDLQPKTPDWDSSVDNMTYSNELRSKTGLRPSSGYNTAKTNKRISSQISMQSSKPLVRKVAGKNNSSSIGNATSAKIAKHPPHHDLSSDSSEGDQEKNYRASAYQARSTNRYQLMNNSKNAFLSENGARPAYRPMDKKSVINDLNSSNYSKSTKNENDFYHWLGNEKSASATNNKSNVLPSKFCHECGSMYPISHAKFCCECGMKRIVLT